MDAAVFLDRDGTLTQDTGYPHRPEELRMLPGAAEALRALRSMGYRLIVVTNQSGLARGIFTEDDLQAYHAELERRLAAAGARLDAVYWCPHHPEGSVERWRRVCACRKPLPGLILQAARDHRIDLAASFLVGDAPRDAEAARAAGCTPILMGTDGDAIRADDWPAVVAAVRHHAPPTDMESL